MPPKKKEIEIKELSQDEINEFLKNSIQIPKEQWPTLPINSYISYYKEDGKFIKGGYIKLIFSKKDPKSDDINEMWSKCDIWITDNKNIIDSCPENKITYKFNTTYNQYFTNKKEISKLTEIQELWSKSLENPTTLTLTESQTNVEPETT